jgi:D-alanine-D-alanine ligase
MTPEYFFIYFRYIKIFEMKINLGLIFGGRSGEHEVSLQSAKSIAAAVNREKYILYLIAIDKSGNWYLADPLSYLENEDDPKNIRLKIKAEQQIALVPVNNSNQIIRLSDGKNLGKLDVAFPIVHGTFGEDGSMQGYFDILNLPCVGANVLGSAVGMDKLVAKKLLIQENIAVADSFTADKETHIDLKVKEIAEAFKFPVFVKPACSGSSVGVYKAHNPSELKDSIEKALKYDSRVLIEKAIIGREIECAVLGNDQLISSIPGEIIPTHSFYSYEAKYIDANGARLEMPAKISEETAKRVKEMAEKAYKALTCSGMARVDMFLTEDGKLYLNEINTLPGFTKISMYPKLMDISGIPYPELIDRLVDLAIDQHSVREENLENVLKASSY